MNTILNRDTAYWQQQDRDHHIHPFSDMGALNKQGSRMIERAEGVHIWDTDGKAYLDGMAGLWCVNMGYAQQSLIEAAHEQMKKLCYYNAFFKTAPTITAELAAKLAEVTPDGFEHVFFSGSGSEANDTVVRMVRTYWQTLGHDNKTVIIARKNGYHGSTITGLSLGGMAGLHAQGGPLLSDIVHINQPFWYAEGGQMSAEEFGISCAQELESVILEHGQDRVAAFIGEPIQGAGGVIVPPATYWSEIQRICDKYGILLVSDEVICGFGRTGNWFGCETMGFKPDLMTMAKGLSSGYLPISGVMVGEKIAKVMEKSVGEFNHGYTYGGHPVSCAVALANITLMQTSGIINTLRTATIPYFKAMLGRLAQHPLVGDIMGEGMLGGIALMKDPGQKIFFEEAGTVGEICRDFCFENGLIMRAVGARMLLSPPLVISRTDIDRLEKIAMKSFDQTLDAVTRRNIQ